MLKKLMVKEELAEEACFAFATIIKYMDGYMDPPSKRPRIGFEVTHHIFGGPLTEYR
jgi:myosin VIIa